jgi:hypothetical protein
MILTCFACNATGSIEAFTKDEAASEFVNLAGNLQPSTWRALIAYIGLFRTVRKMPFDRALKLSRETVALDADMLRLETALGETVEALRAKGGKPLKNHNYLKRVLESTGSGIRDQGSVTAFAGHGSPVPGPASSKTAKAVGRLENWKDK